MLLAKLGEVEKKAAAVITAGANKLFHTQLTESPFLPGEGPLSAFQEAVDLRERRETTREERVTPPGDTLV